MTSPFDPPAHTSPAPPATEPGVLVWARIYTTLMALMNLCLIPLGASMFFIDVPPDDTPRWMLLSQAMAVIGMGVVFGLGNLAPWFMQRSKAKWIVYIVLIAWSCTSCCTWPFSIPLLIFWLKPEVKAYFEGPQA